MQTFTPAVNAAVRAKLKELGGRELRRNDTWRREEQYAMSLHGRRFVFCGLAAYHRFEEFLVTELPLARQSSVSGHGS